MIIGTTRAFFFIVFDGHLSDRACLPVRARNDAAASSAVRLAGIWAIRPQLKQSMTSPRRRRGRSTTLVLCGSASSVVLAWEECSHESLVSHWSAIHRCGHRGRPDLTASDAARCGSECRSGAGHHLRAPSASYPTCLPPRLLVQCSPADRRWRRPMVPVVISARTGAHPVENNDQRHRRTHRAQSRLRCLGAEFRR